MQRPRSHSKLESTGVENDDALELAQQAKLDGAAGREPAEAGPPCPGGSIRFRRRQYSPSGIDPALTPAIGDPRASTGGRDRDRTCDPFHVKEVLYR